MSGDWLALILGIGFAACIFLHWSATRIFASHETIWLVVLFAAFASLGFGAILATILMVVW